MSKAVVFFAEGTEECEALLVVDLLRRAKVDVTVASASGSREILSSHKIRITADALAEEVDYSDVDLVVLPGGIPGTPNLAANKTVTDTCTAFAKSGKKVAAICAATSDAARLALEQIPNLRGCQAHTSVMLSDVDVISFRKLGVELTCEAKKEQKKNYQKD